ncbi:hypothetical protein PtA15_5A490 [Puccinia triticina]|uniref:Uncharacterized protein n=1 Tax=Puccinia triticina TaxID=208348 RepID=A0ABY7CLP3_9BASI|nr:uncharacterized protein PtA15_5A490 [Puccinia triticina]WAQ84917.1 hypothetical protein PtA15_5A490 [Puccinia triticina]
MLFKYLMALIALAASVACYPPSYGGDQSPSTRPDYNNPSTRPDYNNPSTRPDYNNNGVDFSGCLDKIRQVKGPLVASCQRQSIRDANSKLDGLYEPIHSLSTKLHVSIRSDSSVAFKSTRSLVSLFNNFQGIVDTIGKYPRVFRRSEAQETIFEFNSQFEAILNDYSSAGVNVQQVFSQSTNVRFESWQQVGFTFPEKFGFYGDK